MTFLSDATAWGHMDGWGWGMAGFGVLFLLLIAALLVAPTLAGRPTKLDPANRAIEILGERYARGDIDRDEYLARKEDLEG